MQLIGKLISGILLFALLTTGAWAEDTLFDSPAGSDALNDFSAGMGGAQSLRGQFAQLRQLKVLKRPLRSEGYFLFAPDKGLVWQQQTPFPNRLLLQQHQLWQQDSQGHWQQFPTGGADSPAGIMPLLVKGLLSGDISPLQERFQLYLQAGPEWQLGLVPKDPALANLFSRIRVEGAGQLVQRLQLFSANGDCSDIHFSAQEAGPLSDAELATFIPGQTP
ncbi:outer membrane lipoprotein carrier protein LolA [Shewanella sedimentimangrovi]|uniref:Outer membrane lipoprotein carrier protein LolA n=1 Tax=Shewanella sedimentimangrovi TaxID=2814293 RepID=A0ABX7QZS9_9GAMM|nr:outer membrane lipoprotein carrier protein LolA [Shewanella sedimentimangrovi]QSX37052.1 outer membrane lipoprotein carrier protein LolA [Shewanella sedimentimangrovi]